MAYNNDNGMYEGYIYKIYNDCNDKLYIGQTITTLQERWHGHMSACLNENKYKSALYNAMRCYGRNNFHIVQLKKIQNLDQQKLFESLNTLEKFYIQKYNSLTSQNGYNVELGGDNKQVDGRTVHKYDIQLNYLESYPSCEEAGRQNGIDGCTIYSCCKHDYYTAGGFIWCFDGERIDDVQYYLGVMKVNNLLNLSSTSQSLKPQQLFNVSKWWNGKKICTYNAYGALQAVYDNPFDIRDAIGIDMLTLRKNLNGDLLKYKDLIIRYENQPFNYYKMSRSMQPITIYDLSGNIVKCTKSIIEAEQFVGSSSGDVLKTIARGGTCKNYMFSLYGQPLQRKCYQWNKTIEMCDSNWNVIKEFKTLKVISDFFGMKDCHKSLDIALKNKSKYKGYYWKYREEFKLNA